MHSGSTMNDDKHKREGQTGTAGKNQPGKNPGKDPRQDRLKLALRENLKRRKSQARGRGDITIAPSLDDDISSLGHSEKKPNR
jgi:hypothetical protein